MKKKLALLTASVLTLSLVLSGCGGGTSGNSEEPGSGDKGVVNVYNWGVYIDESVLEDFTAETGIEVVYDTYESNEAMYGVLKNDGASYDVIIPSDYMVSRMIEEDMLQPINFDNIPNFADVDPELKNPDYDPENLYTVPYTWGTLGIIYNTTMVDEPITSWSVMFDDSYAGNVILIDNPRDAFGMALYYLGYSVNTTDEAQIREAAELVSNAWSNGVYQGKTMDGIFQIMEGGNAAIGTYYAGDYLTMLENNEDLAYVIPEEGSNWFVDAMCILKDAKNVDEAHEWINFIASTESNLKNMDFIWYASPNTEALEQYPAYYEETYGEPLDMDLYEIMAAPDSVLENCSMYENLPADTLALYNDLWIELGT